MNQNDSTNTIAVLCDNQGISATSVRAHLESQNLTTVQWYDPLDLDDLDEAVCQGRIGHVVLPELPTLLKGIWNSRITFEHWLNAGVRLDFVSPPTAAPESLTRLIFESWQTWQRQHRRRQGIAGSILSAIIVLTVFLFITLMR